MSNSFFCLIFALYFEKTTFYFPRQSLLFLWLMFLRPTLIFPRQLFKHLGPLLLFQSMFFLRLGIALSIRRTWKVEWQVINSLAVGTFCFCANSITLSIMVYHPLIYLLRVKVLFELLILKHLGLSFYL